MYQKLPAPKDTTSGPFLTSTNFETCWSVIGRHGRSRRQGPLSEGHRLPAGTSGGVFDISAVDPNLRPIVHRNRPATSPFVTGDSSARSENRQRIERRPCSLFDAQRRSREKKFVTVQPPRLLDRSLEIEIIENVYAHRDQRQPMQRIWY